MTDVGDMSPSAAELTDLFSNVESRDTATLVTAPFFIFIIASLTGTAFRLRGKPLPVTIAHAVAFIALLLSFVGVIVPPAHRFTTSIEQRQPQTVQTRNLVVLSRYLVRQPNVDPLPSTQPSTTIPPTSTTTVPSGPVPTDPVSSSPPPTTTTSDAPSTSTPSTTTTDSTTNESGSSGFSGIPERDDCSGPLVRMQFVLLLELLFEIIFLFLRCCADAQLNPSSSSDYNDEPLLDVTMRGYILIRAFYTVPVLVLNLVIYWTGGGPTRSCLAMYSEHQIAFAHLILYILYCVLVVVIGVHRILSFQKAETSQRFESSQSPRSFDSNGPPTRTSSYFHYYSRHRHGARPDSLSYEQPKRRIDLGCCALNF